VLRRVLAIASAVAALTALAPVAANAISVRVRVEGATTNLFGATQPLLTPFTGSLVQDEVTVELSQPTALGALEAASLRGELFYDLLASSFGPYVAQIGRFAAEGASGWVYKVDGVSPPVGADAYVLEEGDVVLWYYATFGSEGGPRTLDLRRAGKGCFRAFSVDDTGAAEPASDVVFHRDSRARNDADGRYCPSGHWHRLYVTKDGSVRSQQLGPR
jgi:hypothetical protein